MALDQKYYTYLKGIIETLANNDSFVKKQHEEMNKMFQKFMFTNEQIGEVYKATLVAETQYINSYATSGAMALIQEEEKQALLDAQIRKIEAEIALSEKQSDKMDKEIELVQAQIDKMELESGLISAQISKMAKEELLIDGQISKIDSDIELNEAKKNHVEQQAELVQTQKALADRQIVGYSDNLLVKAGEYQGGLASFAVNANSDDAQSAINEFLMTINQIKSRVT